MFSFFFRFCWICRNRFIWLPSIIYLPSFAAINGTVFNWKSNRWSSLGFFTLAYGGFDDLHVSVWLSRGIFHHVRANHACFSCSLETLLHRWHGKFVLCPTKFNFFKFSPLCPPSFARWRVVCAKVATCAIFSRARDAIIFEKVTLNWLLAAALPWRSSQNYNECKCQPSLVLQRVCCCWSFVSVWIYLRIKNAVITLTNVLYSATRSWRLA